MPNNYSSRIFSTVIEWCITVTWLIIFAAIASTVNDVLTCVTIACSLAIAAIIVTIIAMSKAPLQSAWIAGGVVVAASLIGTSSFVGVSAFLLGFPIAGYLFLRRVIVIQDCDDLSHVSVRWFRSETIGVPIFVILCLLLSPASHYVPGPITLLGAIAYIVVRVFGLLILQRIALKRGSYRPGFRPIAFMVAIVSIVLILAAAANYLQDKVAVFLGWITTPFVIVGLYLLDLLMRLVNAANGAGHKGGGGGRLRGVRPPAAKEHLGQHLPVWFWILLAVVILIILWLLTRYQRRNRWPESTLRMSMTRRPWVPKQTLRLLDTGSYVRRRYQQMLRAMEKGGITVQPDETPREYSHRLANEFAFANERFTKGVSSLTRAYESVRYVNDDAESSEIRTVADEGYQAIASTLEKKS